MLGVWRECCELCGVRNESLGGLLWRVFEKEPVFFIFVTDSVPGGVFFFLLGNVKPFFCVRLEFMYSE